MANTITGEAAGTPVGPGNVTGYGPDASTITNQVQTGLSTDLNKLTNWILSNLQRLRNFRRPYDQRRSYFYRQYISQRDRKMFPDNLTPRSNTFVPYPKSNVDTVVSRVHDAFWGIDPAIECRPKGGTPEQAWQMQAVLLTCLNKANWIQQLELAIRDCAIYGHTAIKVDWDWGYDVVTGIEPVYQMIPVLDDNGQPKLNPDGTPSMIPLTDPMTGLKHQIGQQQVSKKIPRNCPIIRCIDIFDFLIDPDKKQKVEVSEISWGELKRQIEGNPNLYFPEAIQTIARTINQYQELDRDGIIIRIAEFWDDTNKTVSITTFGEDADAIGYKDRRYQFRNASYSAYKRRVYNGPPVLLYTGPNPFAHQRIPILDIGFVSTKGDVYGIGIIETISDLTEAVNVMTNMVTDNWNLGINRRVAYDTTVDIDHDALDMGNVPGGKVGVVGNPKNAIFPLPSFTPNMGDYEIIDLYKGMIEMASGISDFYAKGVGSPTGNRTSSGISQVINESGYMFKLFIRRFELEILQPLCQIVASMIQQFGTDLMEFSCTNNPPNIPKWGYVPLENLLGNYEFDFVAANYATGKVVKQRNLMAFYNLAMQSPYAKQREFLREIALCMDINSYNRLLKTDEEVQQETSASKNAAYKEMIADHLLKFESKAAIEQIKKPEFMPATSVPFYSQNVEHGKAIQEEVERYLANTYDMLFGNEAGSEPIHPVSASPQLGRPRESQFEGTIPGGKQEDHMRGFSQDMGANALGLAGAE